MPMGDNDGPWGPSSDKASKPSGSGSPWDSHSKVRDLGTRTSRGGQAGAPPPDLDPILQKAVTWLKNRLTGSHERLFLLGLGVLVLMWLASGFYQVAADQVGVVMRFGAYDRTEQPGLHYRLPAPIEDVLLPVVTAQNEIQVGFRQGGQRDETARTLPEESLMLTQDENIINVEFTVFWRVGDVRAFLFEIRNPEVTIKMAAESVMREVIGQNKLQFALTDGRSQIAEEARDRLQKLMDEYKAGITVTQINLQTVSVPDDVKAAFQDVVNARLDQERFQNQAAAHVNKVIPDAKGQAAQIVQQAMAYRDQKIALAEGEAARFSDVLSAYTAARDVTSQRLYLETMENVLGSSNKVIVDKGAGGVLPYFPLDAMKKGSTP